MIKRILIYLPLIFTACIDKFEPVFEGTGAEQQLVVQAVLNKDDYYMNIQLSRSVELGSKLVDNPVSGAQLSILNQEGEAFPFASNGDGNYTITQNQFRPQIGDMYKLTIILPSGEIYASDFQEVIKEEPIENLTISKGEGSYVQNGRAIIGEVLEVNAKLARYQQVESYYRYDYQGVYAFKAPFQGEPDFCEEEVLIGGDEPLFDLTCYLADDETLAANVFSNRNILPGKSITENILIITPNRKYAFGYNMQIRKHTINREYYNFLLGIKGQLELNGSLFDPPPSQLVGNIASVNDPNKKALGYFTLESVSTETVFIPSNFFNDPIIDPLNEYACSFDADTPDALPDLWCCDCSLRPGAETEKPENWPN